MPVVLWFLESHLARRIGKVTVLSWKHDTYNYIYIYIHVWYYNIYIYVYVCIYIYIYVYIYNYIYIYVGYNLGGRFWWLGYCQCHCLYQSASERLESQTPLVTQPPLARLSKHPTEVCERHGSAGCKSFTTAEARFATEWMDIISQCLTTGRLVALLDSLCLVCIQSTKNTYLGYLVGGLEHFLFSIYWEFHHPNWRTPSFFGGVGIPPTSYPLVI